METPDQTSNHLLLIAIDKYQDKSVNNLNSCVKDSNAIKDILVQKYFFTPEKTLDLFNDNATNENIHRAFINYISKLTEADNLIIYYSGHGHYEPQPTDIGYWIPFDAKNEQYSSYFPNAQLLDYIKRINTKHLVLISDSCFSRSILTEYEPGKNHKNLNTLYNSKSRWALTAGQYLAYEKNGFAETIISVLQNSEKDILISELIQKVKEAFLTNEKQTPQGLPLRDKNHHAGEFIFKIKEPDFADEKEFKVHKGALKILQLYKRNARFKELFRIEEGNSKNKVGYVVFLEKDDVTKKDYFYLFLYQGIHLSNSFQHIKKTYPDLFKLNNLIILLPKEKDQKNYERRIKNVSENLKPLSIFYIDDFIRDNCSPLFFNEISNNKYLQISNFIIPSIKNINDGNVIESNRITSIDSLKGWFEAAEMPILTIKGSGGIGKTTSAKFIADKFLQTNPKAKVIFIESRVIITKLKSQEDYSESDSISLYNFYEAATPIISERLSKDVFKLNFDAGNILVVIDGLDEVISNVPRFKVDEFITSIERFTDEIRDGKVIITCRSYFWESSRYPSKLIQSLEILPFNKEQTQKFFRISFNNDERKVKKCLEIAREFSFPDNDGIEEFQPYVLDVIRLVINSGRELLEKDSSFNSTILEQKNKKDYIVFRICNRERERVNQISVDEQLRFFIFLAVHKRGTIKAENFKHEVCEALEKEINDTNIEAFKGHPLLQKSDVNFKFKYDFFIDYFNTLYLSSFIKIESTYDKITSELINILAESCWYGSEMIEEIRNKIQVWNGDDLLKISELIQQIFDDDNIKITIKRKTVSALFAIALSITHKFKSNSIEKNTELLKLLFEDPTHKNEINGLSIINFFSRNETIRFDFSDLTVNECYINTFESFWKCSFNKNSYFISPTLLNIEPENLSSATISKEHFINPIWDDKFSSQFELEELKSKNTDENIRYILKKFLGQFHIRGKIDKQPYDRLKLKFALTNQKYFDFKDFIKVVERNGLIFQFFETDREKIDVSDQYKSDVLKFISDGSMSKSIQNIINKLTEIVEKK